MAAADSTFFVPRISCLPIIPVSSNIRSARAEALNSTGSVTIWNKSAAQNSKIPIIKSGRNEKINHAKKFLQDGDKVKVSIRFRGREIHHSALGAKNLERFRDTLSEYGTSDKPPKLEGRSMSLIISPIIKKDW